MKRFIFLLLMMVSVPVYAELSLESSSSSGTSQQTGGNYIYAENGKLTFNLEPSVFENRTWQYNSSLDSAVVQFDTSLPLKTKNASEFYAYEISDSGQIKLVAHSKGDERLMLMHPVYKPNKNGAQPVRVWLPAASWVVRIFGSVARSVLPPIVTRCLSNKLCTGITTVILSHICAFNFAWSEEGGFLREIGFPKGVCEQAEEQGWVKDDTGQYTRNYKYKAVLSFGRKPNSNCPESDYSICAPEYRTATIGGDSIEELKKNAKARCDRQLGMAYENKDPSSSGFGLVGSIVKAEFTESGSGFICQTLARDDEAEFESPGASFSVGIDDGGYKETLQFVDLENLVSEDFKKDPNPYINDKGQVGKELRENIKSSSAIVNKDGTDSKLNLTSNPYTDDKGDVKQDILTIDSMSPSDFILPPMSSGSGGSSGGGSSGGSSSDSGLPASNNNVNMTTIDRPDLLGSPDVKPSANNNPNGTGIGTGSSIGTGGSSSGSGTNGSNSGDSGTGNGTASGASPANASGEGGLDCAKEHRNTLACAQLGDVQDSEGFSIPSIEDKTAFTPDYFLPTSGMCPAPKVTTILGKQYEFSYYWLCQFAEKIRALMIALAFVIAGFIVFRKS